MNLPLSSRWGEAMKSRWLWVSSGISIKSGNSIKQKSRMSAFLPYRNWWTHWLRQAEISEAWLRVYSVFVGSTSKWLNFQRMSWFLGIRTSTLICSCFRKSYSPFNFLTFTISKTLNRLTLPATRSKGWKRYWDHIWKLTALTRFLPSLTKEVYRFNPIIHQLSLIQKKYPFYWS